MSRQHLPCGDTVPSPCPSQLDPSQAEETRSPAKSPSAKPSRVVNAGGEALVQQILLGRQATPENAMTLVRDGLPLSSIARVRKKLKAQQSAVLHLVGMSKEAYKQRAAARQNLNPIESDRLYRLARIEAYAAEVFEDEDLAADWLKTPNRALGEKPLDLLDTDAGTGRVERLLTRIEYGVYS